MVLSVEDIIEMREDTNDFGINGYQWFFNNLENNYSTFAARIIE